MGSYDLDPLSSGKRGSPLSYDKKSVADYVVLSNLKYIGRMYIFRIRSHRLKRCAPAARLLSTDLQRLNMFNMSKGERSATLVIRASRRKYLYLMRCSRQCPCIQYPNIFKTSVIFPSPLCRETYYISVTRKYLFGNIFCDHPYLTGLCTLNCPRVISSEDYYIQLRNWR